MRAVQSNLKTRQRRGHRRVTPFFERDLLAVHASAPTSDDRRVEANRMLPPSKPAKSIPSEHERVGRESGYNLTEVMLM